MPTPTALAGADRPSLPRPPGDEHRAAIVALGSACASCHLHPGCLPCGLPGNTGADVGRPAFLRRRIAAGRMLFAQGEHFRFIYAVRSGSFKSSMSLRNGREQVCGFYMGGDVVALDGMASDHHASSATALVDSEVCALAYAPLLARMGSDPALQNAISRLMSQEIVRTQRHMRLLGQLNAQERLASFLTDLSHRFLARGSSPRDFKLCMSRSEIGSYLGLQLETVSRTLSVMQQQGLLEVDNRSIRITDLGRGAQAMDAVSLAESMTSVRQRTDAAGGPA